MLEKLCFLRIFQSLENNRSVYLQKELVYFIINVLKFFSIEYVELAGTICSAQIGNFALTKTIEQTM